MTGGDSRQTVLVTGASGFLGSHLVRQLRHDGHAVAMLLRTQSDGWRLGDVAGAATVHGDIEDGASLAAAMTETDPEVIFHFAGSASARRFSGGEWQQVRAAQRTNVDGLVNLLEAASVGERRLRMVVRLGGLEEYGSGPSPYVESQREAPRSPYSASQVAGTHLAQALQPHLPFALVTLRPTLIYGPAQSVDFLIPAMIDAFLARRRFGISEGRQRRDLIHVHDFVRAAIALIGRTELAGSVLNVASGEAISIRELAAQVADLTNASDLLDIGVVESRSHDIMDLVGDASAARRLLDWRPTISLAEGLAQTVAWSREERARAWERVRG